MNSRLGRVALATLVGFAAVVNLAVAQERQTGDRFVYTMQMGMGTMPGMKSEMTVKIDRVDPDGSAHANVSLSSPHASDTTFEATLSPAGEIIPPKLDTTKKPTMGMSPSAQKELAGNYAAQMIAMNLRGFNALAAACAAHGALHANDSWHATTTDAMQTVVSYKVTGTKEVAGHQGFVVAMQSDPGAMMGFSGEGYYDPAAHLVLGVHTEMSGGGPGQSQVTEIMLKP